MASPIPMSNKGLYRHQRKTNEAAIPFSGPPKDHIQHRHLVFPPTKTAGYTKNVGSVNTLKFLQKTQRIASLAITGSLRTSPTDLLDIHAGLLPIELALLKACHSAAVRFLALPDTHPLHQITKDARRNPPVKHPSPIDQLLKTLKLRNTMMETIYPIIRREGTPDQFKTEIAETREVSINSEKKDNTDYRIYSDGS